MREAVFFHWALVRGPVVPYHALSYERTGSFS